MELGGGVAKRWDEVGVGVSGRRKQIQKERGCPVVLRSTGGLSHGRA